MFERATREWRTSPTIATWSPSIAAELLLDRVEVEERLGRMLVLAVAGVDDVRRRVAARRGRGAPICGVADDDDVGVVGADRERRVLQRLALVDRRAGRLDRHHVGREALGGELEARGRPGRGLVEEVHDRAAAQRRQLLHLALERAGERARRARGGARRPRASRSAIEIRWRRGGLPRRQELVAKRAVGRRPWAHSLWGDEQDTVDLVDLDELHLDALAARGRQVLSDVVGADRKLAVAAVDEARRAGRARDGRSRRAPRSRRGPCGRCRGRRRRGRTSSPRAGSRAASP